jgi:hypothetical protein
MKLATIRSKAVLFFRPKSHSSASDKPSTFPTTT